MARFGSPDASISALGREGDPRERAFLSPHMCPGGDRFSTPAAPYLVLRPAAVEPALSRTGSSRTMGRQYAWAASASVRGAGGVIWTAVMTTPSREPAAARLRAGNSRVLPNCRRVAAGRADRGGRRHRHPSTTQEPRRAPQHHAHHHRRDRDRGARRTAASSRGSGPLRYRASSRIADVLKPLSVR